MSRNTLTQSEPIPENRIRVVYLVSNHNAGSTPIALLANSHPEMISPGEMIGPGGRFHGAEGPLCSCGERISACRFWQKVGTQFVQKGFNWQPDKWGLDFEFTGHPTLTRFILNRPDTLPWRASLFSRFPWFSSKMHEMLERNVRFAQTVLEVSGRKVILDASKHPKRLFHLSRSPYIDLRVIHLIRDPRGWCNSRRKNFNEPVPQSSLRWVLHNLRIAKLTSKFQQNKKIILRYEDFCRDPQSALSRIWEFAGLQDNILQVNFNHIQHHVLGNRMRTSNNIIIKEDLSWKEELNATDRQSIEMTTHSIATRFGYTF